eukprot:TRINITY_DN4658_c1_g1_i4.p1 TRINITY_DN4658_c1_g1~~TRINITY_DN4658_c1_g1_i4.p1  ORF type:complete len:254 (+),score=37.17 TRINITY_DN4658_c1_g1_i4:183-944(+)
MCFDAGGKNFRHRLYPEYKSQRPDTPESLSLAFPYVERAVQAMGLQIVKEQGVEADDVIATLTKRALEADMRVRIASPDKDFFQLLEPRVRLLRTRSRGNGIDSFGVEEFETMYEGLIPEQFVDVLALEGDASDNVKGVKGIGKKTAPELIRRFGSIENLIENVSLVDKPRYRKAMELGKEAALLSKQLVTLQTDLPLVALDSNGDGDWTPFSFVSPEENGRLFWNLITALETRNVSMGNLRHRLQGLWGNCY